MKTQNTKTRKYSTPVIEIIQLDNDISLQLESDPPTYESSNGIKCSPEHFKESPFYLIKG